MTGAEKGQGRDTDWLFTKEPGNVAISRGRQGVIIIGNMDYLADDRARSLGNFIRLTTERCPILDGEKFEEMLPRARGTPSRGKVTSGNALKPYFCMRKPTRTLGV